MAKIKRSPKNLELDINVAKKRTIPRFPPQAANSAANANSASRRENPRAAEYC